MKTKQQIIETIDLLIKEASSQESSERDRKSALKKLSFNRTVLAYLDTQPLESFLEQERDRLENLIDKIEESWADHYNGYKAFYDNLPKATITAKKKEFLKDLDLAEIKSQLKTIVYILS